MLTPCCIDTVLYGGQVSPGATVVGRGPFSGRTPEVRNQGTATIELGGNRTVSAGGGARPARDQSSRRGCCQAGAREARGSATGGRRGSLQIGLYRSLTQRGNAPCIHCAPRPERRRPRARTREIAAPRPTAPEPTLGPRFIPG